MINQKKSVDVYKWGGWVVLSLNVDKRLQRGRLVLKCTLFANVIRGLDMWHALRAVHILRLQKS